MSLNSTTAPKVPDGQSGNIASMFTEWNALYSKGYERGMSDDAANAIYTSYADLQKRIVAEQARTARDVAIQFYVDTDAFGSDYSDAFAEHIKSLIFPTSVVAS